MSRAVAAINRAEVVEVVAEDATNGQATAQASRTTHGRPARRPRRSSQRS